MTVSHNGQINYLLNVISVNVVHDIHSPVMGGCTTKNKHIFESKQNLRSAGVEAGVLSEG